MRKRWIQLRRALLSVLLLMLASVSLLIIYISSSSQSPFIQSMYFKAQDYNDIIVVMGKPIEPEAQQIYNSVRELLPPDFQVIEPDTSSTYYDYLRDWGRVNSVEKYRDNLMMGFEIKQPPESSIVYYQSSFVHSEAVAVNLLLNAYVRTYLGATHSIQSGVYSYELFRRDYDMQQWVMVIMHLASFGLQTLIISWLILERASGAQQLQAVSGGHYVMFWCANFLFDLALSLVCTALLWGCVVALRASAFLYQHMLLLMLMQFIFSIVVLPFIYYYRFVVQCGKPSTAVLAYITLILVHANRFTFLDRDTVLISPNLHFFVHYSSAAKLEGIPLFMVIVRYVTSALLFDFVFWTLILVFHLVFCHLVISNASGLCQSDKTDTTEQIDDDIIAEKNRILNTDMKLLSKTDALILKKVGDDAQPESFSAVDYISLGIQKGECFGLLGPNGSGTSALFKLLYNDLSCSCGDVYYSGVRFNLNSTQIYQKIGYCPQQDGFHGELTGRESLQLYGRLKGIPKGNLQEVIDSLLKQIMLEVHADKLAKYYSVVDKRKLSIAIALIGNPQFLLLDDPTSGMDMKEKRGVWRLLQNRSAQGCTIILSSQCMEECEALCTRLTIMAQGKLLCLGTPQHLKTKYAQGFTITVHLKPEPGHAMGEVIEYLKELFDQIEIFNQLDTYLHLQVPAEMFPLSVLFDKMETAKKDLDLEHYSIQQTSLEQVFLMFMNKTKPQNTTELAESKLSDNDKHSTVL